MYKFAYRQSPRLQTRGFTLLDILLSISILALVLGLGVPSLTEILNTHKKKTSLSSILHMMNFARQTAIDTRENITLCPSTDLINCSRDWRNPVIVFLDKDANREISEEDTLLRVRDVIDTSQQLTMRSSANRQYVQFQADGSTRGQNGSFYLCQTHGESAGETKARIIFYHTGRSRIAKHHELTGSCN
ncbi:GspH/FimT family pseudopilin [Teredinibacter waterburyi]|uniref:GspH/FimT family pseudopilin n=1 Tax=Teredinibacter waterburyi TaxID=1500538 RepID=UPI00165F788E|nr:GspH/FimT family pseudopilin [Teredinibacter waterburyi]